MRGQSAIEFVTTYGWAIAVLLLIIGVFYYNGFIGGGEILPERCSLTQGLGCLEYAANNGNIYLGIQNNMAKRLNWVNLTFESEDCSNWPLSREYTVIENNNRLLLNGESEYTTLPCVSEKKKIKGFIKGNYQLAGEEVTHPIEGDFILTMG